MVQKWLLRKGFRRILYGIIIVLLGSIILAIDYPYPIVKKERGIIPEPYRGLFLSDIGNGLIMFGPAVLLIGFMYFLATTILEYMKKRRLAYRSKI
jgi:hypothetical protein